MVARSVAALSLVAAVALGQQASTITCFGRQSNTDCSCPLSRTPRSNILDLGREQLLHFAQAFASVAQTDEFLAVAQYHATTPGLHDSINILIGHEYVMAQIEDLLRNPELTGGRPWTTGFPWYPVDARFTAGGFDLVERDVAEFIGGSSGPLRGPYQGLVSYNPTRGVAEERNVVTHAFTRQYELPDAEFMEELDAFSGYREWALAFMSYHASLHFCIGGTMNDTKLSPYDPAFFVFVHSYMQEHWRRHCYESRGTSGALGNSTVTDDVDGQGSQVDREDEQAQEATEEQEDLGEQDESNEQEDLADQDGDESNDGNDDQDEDANDSDNDEDGEEDDSGDDGGDSEEEEGQRGPEASTEQDETEIDGERDSSSIEATSPTDTGEIEAREAAEFFNSDLKQLQEGQKLRRELQKKIQARDGKTSQQQETENGQKRKKVKPPGSGAARSLVNNAVVIGVLVAWLALVLDDCTQTWSERVPQKPLNLIHTMPALYRTIDWFAIPPDRQTQDRSHLSAYGGGDTHTRPRHTYHMSPSTGAHCRGGATDKSLDHQLPAHGFDRHSMTAAEGTQQGVRDREKCSSMLTERKDAADRARPAEAKIVRSGIGCTAPRDLSSSQDNVGSVAIVRNRSPDARHTKRDRPTINDRTTY